MDFLTKDLYFCTTCLKANNFEEYNNSSFDKDCLELYQHISLSKKELPIIENLCFEGGGIRTFCYIGGLQVFEHFKLLDNVKRCSGSSAGALFAMLVALEYTTTEMVELIVNTDLTKYQDRYMVSAISHTLFSKFSLYSGYVLESDIKSFVKLKFDQKDPEFFKDKSIDYNPTLKDLYDVFDRELITTASNLTYRRLDYFSPKLTPNIPIYLAVRMSMALPYILEYVEYNGCKYVDGGLCNNLPLNVFHNYPNPYIYAQPGEKVFENSLGFGHSDSKSFNADSDAIMDDFLQDTQKSEINTLKQYSESLLNLLLFLGDDLQLKMINLLDPENKHAYFKKVIEVIIPHLTVANFSATLEQKKDAITIFKIATIKFLRKLYQLE